MKTGGGIKGGDRGEIEQRGRRAELGETNTRRLNNNSRYLEEQDVQKKDPAKGKNQKKEKVPDKKKTRSSDLFDRKHNPEVHSYRNQSYDLSSCSGKGRHQKKSADVLVKKTVRGGDGPRKGAALRSSVSVAVGIALRVVG